MPESHVTASPPVLLPAVSIVLPAYNESAIINRTLDRVCAHMAGLEDRFRWEIVVVNDGSTDGTGQMADDYAAAHPNVRVIRHHVNFNLGQALRSAFNSCRGDYVITLDTDLSYEPSHVDRLLDTIVATRAKIVIASPYLKAGEVTGVPAFRLLLSRGANRLLGWASGGELTTITGMVRAYDRVFLSSLNLVSHSTEINTEIVYKAQLLGARIVEIPAHLDWTEQNELGDQRGSSIRIGRAVRAQASSGFLFRPLWFFTVPGMVLLLCSLYTVVLGGQRWWEQYGVATGSWWSRIGQAAGLAFAEAPHVFVLGGISLVLSVQLLSLGIVSAQAKRYFEELFHLGTGILRHVRLDAELFEPTSISPWMPNGDSGQSSERELETAGRAQP